MGDFNFIKIIIVNSFFYDYIVYCRGADLRVLFYLDWGDFKDI